MSTKKPDRRIARTRELALDAFRKLMIDRGFERITVQHVLDRAGIGRATFYAHFRSKQDLLTASIARLQAGTCWINHYNVTPVELPFGGVKLSGLGRENGRAALEHYTQLKSVYVAMSNIDAPY